MNTNITFELIENESANDNTKTFEYEQLLTNINDLIEDTKTTEYDDSLLKIKNYELNYNVKELKIICDYYGILNEAKHRRLKKLDIIQHIVMFESDNNNEDKVNERLYLWDLMEQLNNNPFMKKFILW